MRNPVKTIAFLVVRGFSGLSLVSAIEPLRGANRLLGREAYAWYLVTDDGQPIRASNGLTMLPDLSLADLSRRLDDMFGIFACAGLDADPPNRARINACLVRAARSGLVVGSLSAGTFILARAGLLEGYRCTVHWEFQPAFEEEFPHLASEPGLYVIDRNRWTGSGGITGMDMMLHMIEADHGPALARSVGNQFQIDRIRNAAIHQRPGALDRMETLPATLQEAVNLMLANVEAPLRMDELADMVGLNLRRMERMFQAHFDMSPAQFYRSIRLEKARDLLVHTNLSTLEIGVLTGFSSSSHFAMAYQKHYGIRPSDERKRAVRE